MAFLGDIGKVFFGGASTKDVVQTGALLSGASLPTAMALGSGAGMIAEDISKLGNRGETTTTQTVQSAQAGMPHGPAQNIEIDFSGRGDMGSMMPAMYRPMPGFTPPMPQPMMQQANVLKFAPAVGGAVAGFVGDMIFDFITGTEKKLIITRKLKRDTEKLMELLNNDMDEVARVLTDTKKKAFDSGTVLKILMHKFTNQGPYVTKAAVRKTRKTVRKLETLKKLHADVCGRATPARRRTTRRTSAMAKASC